MTQRRGIVCLGVLAATTFLLPSSATAQSSGAPVHRGIQHMRGAVLNRAASASPAAATNPQNMTYYGGLLLPNTTTYAIWWGNPSDFPTDARDGLDNFLESLDGSEYLQIADQYMFGQKTRTRFGGNLFDYSAPPVQDVPSTDIVAEVHQVLTANGMKADPTALYTVYVSNFPNENYYCAYHDVAPAPDGTPIHIIYVPNDTSAVSGCGTNFSPLFAPNVDPLFTPNTYSGATSAMANSTAHEVMESITDPDASDGWVNLALGVEIGDPCNFIFQSWVPLTVGRWKIQEIWSNAAGGCAQGNGRPAQVLGVVSTVSSINTFDIPGAALGIFSQSINNIGVATGYYNDANDAWHGFVRGSLGKITIIDVPGGTNTVAFASNALGTITGRYTDTTNFVRHCFLRDTHGNFSTIDAPGAVNGTFVTTINDRGAVAGRYNDANCVSHAFIRNSLGTFATFDAPGAGYAGCGPTSGTAVSSINAFGAVAGNFVDAGSVNHAVIRRVDGTITTFDAPGASQGTFAQSINDFGVIAGYYTDSNFVSHGFVRDPLGHITTFDDPNATSGTFALSINAFGAVAGYYSDKNGFPQGFVRDRYGNFLTLPGKRANYGMVVLGINDFGATAGYETAATN